MANDNNFTHLAALHEQYERLSLRGLWQRDSRSAPVPEPRIWRWSDMQPILDDTLRQVRLPEDTDQRVIGIDVPGLSTGAVFVSYQMINPGEKIPLQRHTPAQMRFIVKGSDFAHATGDWPESRRMIEQTFVGVPADERYAMLAGNAIRFFRLKDTVPELEELIQAA